MEKKNSSSQPKRITVTRVEVDYGVNDPDPSDIMVTENTVEKNTYRYKEQPTPAQFDECFKKLAAHVRARKRTSLEFWIRDGFLISDPRLPKKKPAAKRKKTND